METKDVQHHLQLLPQLTGGDKRKVDMHIDNSDDD